MGCRPELTSLRISRVALQESLEHLDIGAVQYDISRIPERPPVRDNMAVEVSFDAPWVIFGRRPRPKIDSPVREGAFENASTTRALRHSKERCRVFKRAIASQRCWRSIQERRALHVAIVLAPVPVGKRALVPALVTERFFVRPDEVSVEEKKQRREMHAVKQLEVEDAEVIKAGSCAVNIRVQRLFVHEALDSTHEVDTLLGGNASPI